MVIKKNKNRKDLTIQTFSFASHNCVLTYKLPEPHLMVKRRANVSEKHKMKHAVIRTIEQ